MDDPKLVEVAQKVAPELIDENTAVVMRNGEVVEFRDLRESDGAKTAFLKGALDNSPALVAGVMAGGAAAPAGPLASILAGAGAGMATKIGGDKLLSADFVPQTLNDIFVNKELSALQNPKSTFAGALVPQALTALPSRALSSLWKVPARMSGLSRAPIAAQDVRNLGMVAGGAAINAGIGAGSRFMDPKADTFDPGLLATDLAMGAFFHDPTALGKKLSSMGAQAGARLTGKPYVPPAEAPKPETATSSQTKIARVRQLLSEAPEAQWDAILTQAGADGLLTPAQLHPEKRAGLLSMLKKMPASEIATIANSPKPEELATPQNTREVKRIIKFKNMGATAEEMAPFINSAQEPTTEMQAKWQKTREATKQAEVEAKAKADNDAWLALQQATTTARELKARVQSGKVAAKNEGQAQTRALSDTITQRLQALKDAQKQEAYESSEAVKGVKADIKGRFTEAQQRVKEAQAQYDEAIAEQKRQERESKKLRTSLGVGDASSMFDPGGGTGTIPLAEGAEILLNFPSTPEQGLKTGATLSSFPKPKAAKPAAADPAMDATTAFSVVEKFSGLNAKEMGEAFELYKKAKESMPGKTTVTEPTAAAPVTEPVVAAEPLKEVIQDGKMQSKGQEAEGVLTPAEGAPVPQEGPAAPVVNVEDVALPTDQPPVVQTPDGPVEVPRNAALNRPLGMQNWKLRDAGVLDHDKVRQTILDIALGDDVALKQQWVKLFKKFNPDLRDINVPDAYPEGKGITAGVRHSPPEDFLRAVIDGVPRDPIKWYIEMAQGHETELAKGTKIPSPRDPTRSYMGPPKGTVIDSPTGIDPNDVPGVASVVDKDAQEGTTEIFKNAEELVTDAGGAGAVADNVRIKSGDHSSEFDKSAEGKGIKAIQYLRDQANRIFSRLGGYTLNKKTSLKSVKDYAKTRFNSDLISKETLDAILATTDVPSAIDLFTAGAHKHTTERLEILKTKVGDNATKIEDPPKSTFASEAADVINKIGDNSKRQGIRPYAHWEENVRAAIKLIKKTDVREAFTEVFNKHFAPIYRSSVEQAADAAGENADAIWKANDDIAIETMRNNFEMLPPDMYNVFRAATKADEAAIYDYAQAQKFGVPMELTEYQQTLWDAVQHIKGQERVIQNDVGMPIDGRAPGEDPNWVFTKMRAEIGEQIRNPTHEMFAQRKQEWMDTMAEQGVEPEQALEMFDGMRGTVAIAGVTPPKSGSYFSSIREPKGYNIPESWRDSLFASARNYVKRASYDLSRFHVIENDPFMSDLIKSNRDPRLVDWVDSMDALHSGYSDLADKLASGVQAVRLGPVSAMRDLLGTLPTTAQFAHPSEMARALYDTVGITTAIRNGPSVAQRTGVLQSRHVGEVLNPEMIGEWYGTAINGIRAAQGRNAAQWVGSHFADTLGRIMARTRSKAEISQMLGYDVTAMPQHEIETRMALEAVRSSQGLYGTDLPNWLIRGKQQKGDMKGTARAVFAIGRWGFEQFNSFRRHTLDPLRKGDPRPLIKGLLAGAGTTAIVDYLAEQILDVKPREMTLEDFLKLNQQAKGGSVKVAETLAAKIGQSGFGGVLGTMAVLANGGGAQSGQGVQPMAISQVLRLGELIRSAAQEVDIDQKTGASDKNIIDAIWMAGNQWMMEQLQFIKKPQQGDQPRINQLYNRLTPEERASLGLDPGVADLSSGSAQYGNPFSPTTILKNTDDPAEIKTQLARQVMRGQMPQAPKAITQNQNRFNTMLRGPEVASKWANDSIMKEMEMRQLIGQLVSQDPSSIIARKRGSAEFRRPIAR
jgi:hypothetical protein